MSVNITYVSKIVCPEHDKWIMYLINYYCLSIELSLARKSKYSSCHQTWRPFSIAKIYWNIHMSSLIAKTPNTHVRPTTGKSTHRLYKPVLKIKSEQPIITNHLFALKLWFKVATMAAMAVERSHGFKWNKNCRRLDNVT